MRQLLLILLMFVFGSSFSQVSSLSRYEKCWAVFHPFAALKVKKITSRCYPIYYQPSVKLQLDSFAGGGKLDAFRHVFFMAAFAQKIKVKKLSKLGIAHEKGNYRQFLRSETEEGERPDSLSSVMDLENNALGLKIGRENKKLPLEALKQVVMDEIKNGKAVILKRNSQGRYVDCNGSLIDLRNYSKTWQVPKCLVASDSH